MYDTRLDRVEELVEYPRLVGTVPEEGSSMGEVKLHRLVQELQDDMEETLEEEEVEDKQGQALAIGVGDACFF